MNLKRRDLLDACRLAGVSMKDLESSPEGQLALAFLLERRSGDTDLEFEQWLDEDLEVEVDVEDAPDPS